MKAYTEYKNTNFSLLDKIPKTWNIQKIKFFTTIYSGDSLNDDFKSQFESDNKDELAYISSKDINVDTAEIQYDNGLRIPKNYGKFKIALTNSTLLCIEGGSAGRKIAFTNQDVCFVNKLACFKVQDSFSDKFLFYSIKATPFQSQFKNSITGMIGGVSIANLKNFYLSIPSIEEQIKIANFLDYQTGVIDDLIKQKEKFIELLIEQRKAIINEAVTKGINPIVKMKDSGIEWLGEIPEEWKIIKLKFIIKELESGVSVNSENTPIDINSLEKGILKTSCVFDYSFNPLENKKVVDEEIDRVKCPVRKNVIILSRMNTPELVGASGYVEIEYPNLFLPDRLWQTIFNEKSELDVEFISYILKSEIYKGVFSTIATGTSPSMKNIGQNAFLDLAIPFPNLNEQIVIKNYLKQNENSTNAACDVLKGTIEKLKEYRQSIISEAVTGKIDVREWKENNVLSKI